MIVAPRPRRASPGPAGSPCWAWPLFSCRWRQAGLITTLRLPCPPLLLSSPTKPIRLWGRDPARVFASELMRPSSTGSPKISKEI